MIFAIGCSLLLTVLALAAFDSTKNLINEYLFLKQIAGGMALLGIVMMVGSFCLLLWRVMP